MAQRPSGFEKLPLASFAVCAAIALRTFSSPSPYAKSWVGLMLMRTAGAELPPTDTWPTPVICDSLCSKIVEAASYMAGGGSLSGVSAEIMIGASAGFTLRYVGLLGILAGKKLRAALIADSTS